MSAGLNATVNRKLKIDIPNVSTILAPANNSARALALDTTTQGSWIGKYGALGYNLISTAADPGTYASTFVTVTPSANNFYDWTNGIATTTVRALQDPTTPSNRYARTWYSDTTENFDVSFTDSSVHQIAFYVIDWDPIGRAETIRPYDGVTGLPLASAQNIAANAAFRNGEYSVWNVSGHVTFQITKTAAQNAVISGIFFQY